MDSAISQKEQNVVIEPSYHRGNVVLELSKQRCKVGRTTETDTRESRTVQFDNTLDTNNLGVSRVTVDGEAVVNILAISWHSARDSSESINGEAAV